MFYVVILASKFYFLLFPGFVVYVFGFSGTGILYIEVKTYFLFDNDQAC